MIITPMNGNVLLEPVKGEEKTASGLIIPDSEKEKNIGIVIEVPEDCVVSKGQKVQYREFAGQVITVNMKNYLLVPEEDLLCVFEEDETDTGKDQK